MTHFVLHSPDEIAAFVARRIPAVAEVGGFPTGCLAIGIGDGAGALVGGVVLERRGHFDGYLSIALDTPRAATRTACREIAHFIFADLGLRRLTAHVAAGDDRARRALERLGFREEGLMRRGYDGDRDAVLLGLLPEECPWLRSEHDG